MQRRSRRTSRPGVHRSQASKHNPTKPTPMKARRETRSRYCSFLAVAVLPLPVTTARWFSGFRTTAFEVPVDDIATAEPKPIMTPTIANTAAPTADMVTLGDGDSGPAVLTRWCERWVSTGLIKSAMYGSNQLYGTYMKNLKN